jgi:hypothetical protein
MSRVAALPKKRISVTTREDIYVDGNQLGGAFRNLNQLAITAERGEEIAMQHGALTERIISPEYHE